MNKINHITFQNDLQNWSFNTFQTIKENIFLSYFKRYIFFISLKAAKKKFTYFSHFDKFRSMSFK